MLKSFLAATALVAATALPAAALTGAEKAEAAGRCLAGLGLRQGTEVEVAADAAHFAVVKTTNLGLQQVKIVVNDGISAPDFLWRRATQSTIRDCLAGGKT